jgi:membrane protein implicated in regulation of membrane protease activity
MSTVRAVKKLVLGETWLLPIGLALMMAAGVLLRELAPATWSVLGGAFLLVAVLALALGSVSWSARKRPRRG